MTNRQEPSASVKAEEWQRKCDEVSVSQDQLNQLVLNFLETETFQDEAGLPQRAPPEAASERMHVRNAIEQGRISDAIAQVNDLDPEILEEDSRLLFRVQRQHLVELIRVGKCNEALAFAQEYLAYKGEHDSALLDDLESAVALLAFPDPAESPMKDLLADLQRQSTATEINKALLKSFDQDAEPRLFTLLKLLAWGQDKLAQHVKFPHLDAFKPPDTSEDTMQWTGGESTES